MKPHALTICVLLGAGAVQAATDWPQWRGPNRDGHVPAGAPMPATLPKDPKPPFYYQLVFSVNGLINEFVEPAKILRHGKNIEMGAMVGIDAASDGLARASTRGARACCGGRLLLSPCA